LILVFFLYATYCSSTGGNRYGKEKRKFCPTASAENSVLRRVFPGLLD
jgi:hypothetical protein